MNMCIRPLEFSDAKQLAILHKKIFKRTHFSSVFSLNLLEKYFNCLLKDFDYKFAVDENSQIIGYLIAGKNPGTVIDKFLKQNIYAIVFVLIKNPNFIFEKLRNTYSKFFNSKPDAHAVATSIYLIAVSPATQNKGIGKQLMFHFEEKLRQKKIDFYTLAVRPDNHQAIDFYNKNGFIEIARDYKTISFMKKLIL